MGADQSKLQTILVPQQNNPICAVDSRFMFPYLVQLKIREKMFSLSEEFKIIDPCTGTVYFRCEGRLFSIHEKKTLLDTYGQPVLNMKEAVMSLKDKFSIYAGNNSDRLICKFKTQWGLKPKLYARFRDVQSGAERVLILKGDRMGLAALVYVGEPKAGGAPVAKIYRQAAFFAPDEYAIDIAPGVDISLIVMLCIALDEHTE